MYLPVGITQRIYADRGINYNIKVSFANNPVMFGSYKDLEKSKTNIK